jgi:hypothetical protein
VRVTGHGPGGPGSDDLLAQLARWSAAERAARAASGRARARSLIEQSAAEATLSGLLVDLAEEAAEVTLGLASMERAFGRGIGPGAGQVSGRLVGVGRDVLIVERPGRGAALVRTAAVTSVTPLGSVVGPARPGGQRPPGLDLTMAAALDSLGADGAPVTVRTADATFAGVVLACGQDVVTLRTEGAERRPVYLALGAIMCVELR